MNKNRWMKKAVVAGLTMTLAAGQAVCSLPYMGSAAQKKTSGKEKESAVSGKSDVSKQESVYVNLDASGKPSDITVTDWLKNVTLASTLKDQSELKNIENVKGEETFEHNNGALVWNTDQKDIYYQGKINKELPVTMNITYKLDGKEISPENLAGKNGKMEMHILYKNQRKDGDVYVPFVMITGVILPTDHFSNIAVDHGKILSDADKTIVAGLALPGLEESLDLSDAMKEDIDLPSSITITADAEDFEMMPTFTLATSEALEDFNIKDMDSYQELKDSMEELKDASEKLVDGSGDLEDGVKTLKDKSGDFKDGIGTLNHGLSQLDAGAGDLASGIKSYTDGAEALNSGIQKLKKAVKGLPEKLGSLGALASGITSAKDGADQLVTSTGQLEKGMQSVNGGLDTVSATLEQVTALLSSVEGADTDPKIQQAIGALTQLAQTTGEGGELNSGASQVEAGLGQLKEGEKSLRSGLGQMEKGVSGLSGQTEQLTALTEALNQLGAGSETLAKNSKSLVNGAQSIQSATRQLEDGGNKLNDGAGELTDGVSEIYDGSKDLKDGMQEFHEDGVMKLYDTINDDLDKMVERLDAISKAGKNYRSFAGISDSMEGTVRFIMETAEIKK